MFIERNFFFYLIRIHFIIKLLKLFFVCMCLWDIPHKIDNYVKSEFVDFFFFHRDIFVVAKGKILKILHISSLA